jgi:hypothetical protein
MKVRTLLITALVAAGGLAGAGPASAHQSPDKCNANKFDAQLVRDKLTVKNDDIVNYHVQIKNLSDPGALACDVSGITVRVQLPGPDGNPSGVFQTVVAGATYPSGQTLVTYGPFPYIVNANPGVTRLVARLSFAGVLHDGPVDSDESNDRTIGLYLPTPAIEVDKTADIKSGIAPQNVTYSFRVYNRTNPPYPLDNVTLSDDQCPGVTRPTPNGDDNGDGRLDPAEVWLYTCTMAHGVGTFTNVATACGVLNIDSGPLPPVCDTDTETVEFTPPPPPAAPPVVLAAPPATPVVAVKPVSVNQAPCTMARVNSTTVRAGQLNTIRVRVRNVDAGTTVKLTLPGSKKAISAKTDKTGIATFKVRPTKTGTAKIQASECSSVERLSVKPARKVVSQAKPRVTG